MQFKEINLEEYRLEVGKIICSKAGKFSDGRPYIEECWETCGDTTLITIFMPSVGFEIDKEWKEFAEKGERMYKVPDDIQAYLEQEGYNRDSFKEGVSVSCFGGETNHWLSVDMEVLYLSEEDDCDYESESLNDARDSEELGLAAWPLMRYLKKINENQGIETSAIVNEGGVSLYGEKHMKTINFGEKAFEYDGQNWKFKEDYFKWY